MANALSSSPPPPVLDPGFDEWFKKFRQENQRGAQRIAFDTWRVRLNHSTSVVPGNRDRFYFIARAMYKLLPVWCSVTSDVDVPASRVIWTNLDLRNTTTGRSLLVAERPFSTNIGLTRGVPVAILRIDGRVQRRGLDPKVKTGQAVALEWFHVDNSSSVVISPGGGGESEFPQPRPTEIAGVMLTEITVQLAWVPL